MSRVTWMPTHDWRYRPTLACVAWLVGRLAGVGCRPTLWSPNWRPTSSADLLSEEN